MLCSLFVLNGPSPGESLRLDSALPVITLGRQATCDLQIDDNRASRLHARLRFRAGAWHLEDANSRNGTLVNSEPVTQKILERGDLIRIGQRLILFADQQLSAVAPSPAQFRSTTLVGQAPMNTQWGKVVENTLTGPVSRVVRDSTLLCHLAGKLHSCNNTRAMGRTVVESLDQGIETEKIVVWLLGADGRLRCAGALPRDLDQKTYDRSLANVALENNKAILCGPAEEDGHITVEEDPASIGTVMCVPISGHNQRLGAIECHANPEGMPFERSDLDLVTVVASQVGLALENLSHRERLELANEHLRQRVASQTALVGSSSKMQGVLDQIARVGSTGSNVLVLGESGTGKELIARSLHEVSPRSAGPYVTVNCAAPNESLLESELFGHEAGAFTGADRQRIGLFEQAHLGTLFLDEVGEMSLASQAKLLRVLEGHPFQRVGGHDPILVDVRLVAATHRDLEKMVREGQFREDLYYRLRVVDIQAPPLREREGDALELATLFLEQFRSQIGRGPVRFSDEARLALENSPWPGNVRQLRNAIERAVVLGTSDELQVADLGISQAPNDSVGSISGEMISLKEAERRHIEFVLRSVKGNKTAACKVLSIGRATLYSKLAGEQTGDDRTAPNGPVSRSETLRVQDTSTSR